MLPGFYLLSEAPGFDLVAREFIDLKSLEDDVLDIEDIDKLITILPAEPLHLRLITLDHAERPL